MNAKTLKSKLFDLKTEADFNVLAIQIFAYQRQNNPVYCDFLNLIRFQKTPEHYLEIPCLPISFFKSHSLYYSSEPAEIFFLSSSTGGINSKHPVSSLAYYLNHAKNCFTHFYGDLNEYCFLALLPSYLEREGSSLISMVHYFIQESGNFGGFYLQNKKELAHDLVQLQNSGKKIILLGVTFALLEFAKEFPGNYSTILVMETGGMKGRGKELTRNELHETLKKAFQVKEIHSEYGMTELLSQAYSQGQGRFYTPPYIKFACRNPNDPFELFPNGKSGALNCYDLANIDSISFIATDDLGTLLDDNSFELIGRLDHSDLRGCNLLVL